MLSGGSKKTKIPCRGRILGFGRELFCSLGDSCFDIGYEMGRCFAERSGEGVDLECLGGTFQKQAGDQAGLRLYGDLQYTAGILCN